MFQKSNVLILAGLMLIAGLLLLSAEASAVMEYTLGSVHSHYVTPPATIWEILAQIFFLWVPIIVCLLLGLYKVVKKIRCGKIIVSCLAIMAPLLCLSPKAEGWSSFGPSGYSCTAAVAVVENKISNLELAYLIIIAAVLLFGCFILFFRELPPAMKTRH